MKYFRFQISRSEILEVGKVVRDKELSKEHESRTRSMDVALRRTKVAERMEFPSQGNDKRTDWIEIVKNARWVFVRGTRRTPFPLLLTSRSLRSGPKGASVIYFQFSHNDCSI